MKKFKFKFMLCFMLLMNVFLVCSVFATKNDEIQSLRLAFYNKKRNEGCSRAESRNYAYIGTNLYVKKLKEKYDPAKLIAFGEKYVEVYINKLHEGYACKEAKLYADIYIDLYAVNITEYRTEEEACNESDRQTAISLLIDERKYREGDFTKINQLVKTYNKVYYSKRADGFNHITAKKCAKEQVTNLK